MKTLISSLLALCFVVIAQPARAFNSPLSVAIIPPVQFPSSEFSVTGLRASAIWGHHRDVYGLDFGLIGNMTDLRFVGAAVSGIFNYTAGETTILGLQAAAIANINIQKTNVYGLQVALLNKNDAESGLVGLQLGAINLSPNMRIAGLQVGLYNKARSVYGFQFGIVNQTTDLHGIQIGVLNFASNGPFAVSPILNIGF